MADEVVFSEEQQALVDKLVGQARMKSRQQAKEEFEADMAKLEKEKLQQGLEEKQEWERLAKERAGEIESLKPMAEKVEAYEDLIGDLLESKLTALGEKAERFVSALPEGMTSYDKLKWLADNAELFEEDDVPPGTPKRRVRKTGENTRNSGRGNPKARL